VHVVVGVHHDQQRGQLVDEGGRGIRQLVGGPELLQPAADGLERGVAVLVGHLGGRGEHGEVSPVEAAQRMVDRVGREQHLGEVEEVAHAGGVEFARLQCRREFGSRQPPESCGELEHRPPVSSIRPGRRGLDGRR